MQWAEVAQFLDSGAAMLGASADDAGRPEAFRVWGARACGDRRVRILASTDACDTFQRVGAGTLVALLVTDISTFRSLQLKGRATSSPLPPDPDDMVRFRRYDEQFGDALEAIGHPRQLGTSLRPLAIFTVELDVDRFFDQTPGPGAGAPV